MANAVQETDINIAEVQGPPPMAGVFAEWESWRVVQSFEGGFNETFSGRGHLTGRLQGFAYWTFAYSARKSN